MLAANFSERPDNSQSGGDMGFITESQLRSEPEVYAAINKLKPGQVTEVLPLYENSPAGKRPVGYAIYRLLDKEAAGQRELNDPARAAENSRAVAQCPLAAAAERLPRNAPRSGPRRKLFRRTGLQERRSVGVAQQLRSGTQ